MLGSAIKPEAFTATGSRLEALLRNVVSGVSGVIVLAYFGLVGVGQWQPDEYGDFAQLSRGVAAILERLKWSPRPLSELLFAAYGWLTLRVHQPLTPLFLAVLWGGLIAVTLPRLQGNERQARRLACMTGMTLVAAFLTSGPLMEVFYWPAGAVAYLPTLAATLFLFLQIMQGRLDDPRGRVWCAAALLVASLCSETGAILAISFGFVTAVLWLANRRRRPLTWILWPTVAGVAVLLVVQMNRFQMKVGQPVPSFWLAASDLSGSVLGPGLHKHGLPLLNTEFLSIALLAIAISLWWRSHGDRMPATRQVDLVAIGTALLLAALVTLTVSYIHLGLVGERHQFMVRCWVRLAMIAGLTFVLSSERFPSARFSRKLPPWAPVFLIASIVVVWHIKPLIREYQAYPAVYQTVQGNFRSGFVSGSDTVEWTLPPNRGVITAATIEPGIYDRNSSDAYAKYILEYFRKTKIVVQRQRD